MLDAGGETNAFPPTRPVLLLHRGHQLQWQSYDLSAEAQRRNLIKSDCLSLEGNLDWYTAKHIMIHTGRTGLTSWSYFSGTTLTLYKPHE